MTDLCIINSPLFRDSNALYDEDSLPPIGLGYIASVASNSGLSVVLVDAVANRIPLKRLVDDVRALSPKAVAINIFTTNYVLVKEFVESLRSSCAHVILGGLSTRTLYKEIFKWKYAGKIDIVFGDGELIVPDLLRGIEKQFPFETQGNMRFFRVDNSSPYFCNDISNLPLDRSYFSNEPIHHPRGFMEANIVASRGCIYNCSFCAAARSLNKDLAIRERTISSLVNELNEIVTEFPHVSSIRVLDDLFLKGASCIANAIALFSQFSLKWRSMAHVMTFQGVSLDTLIQLRDCGCSELFVGIESGSPRVLKSIHKTHDIEKIRSNLIRVMEAGIPLKGYFIYGFPNETAEDFDKTYRLACDLKEASIRYGVSFRTSVFQFRPYHGTELFHSLVKNGVSTEGVMQVNGNADLSSLVGRLQFNFHSGNYANAPIEIVHDFVYKTANLSSATDWGLS